MFEGNATARTSQIIVGIGLGILTGMSFLVGLVGFYAILLQHNLDSTTFIITIIFLPIGVVGLFISFRLIKAKGSKKGGGLLSPAEYKYLGVFFVSLSVFVFIYGVLNSSLKHMLLSPSPLTLTSFCFVAARFRGGMRNLPEKNKR